MTEGKAPRKDLVIGLALVLVSMAVRAAYILCLNLPPFDPWRHLALIENIRAGKGFTLFAGQPYIWYHPLWYRICAVFPKAIGPEWIAGVFSAVSVGLLFLWLRLRSRMDPEKRAGAAIAAIMACVFGPMIAFTCHYGPEAFAVCAVLAALCLAETRGSIPAAAVAGILAGLAGVTRLNLLWAAVIGIVAVRGRGRKIVFAAGAAVPIALAWLRNHAAIGSYPFLMTWDGIATRSADFNIFSTLAVQAHPTVKAALTALHKMTAPMPEWLWSAEGVPWSSALFMLAGTAALVLWKRRTAGLIGVLALAYMVFLDPTRTGNYFRIYVGLFPLMFAALAELSERLARVGGRLKRWVPAAMALGVIFCGVTFLVPGDMVPIEAVTPNREFLKPDACMVNSGLYQPEALAYAFPGRKFIGLPLRPEEFDAFRKAFPEFKFILWHDIGVQDRLKDYLIATGRAVPVGSDKNAFGLRYDLWELTGKTSAARD
jgi:hypothetical protein